MQNIESNLLISPLSTGIPPIASKEKSTPFFSSFTPPCVNKEEESEQLVLDDKQIEEKKEHNQN